MIVLHKRLPFHRSYIVLRQSRNVIILIEVLLNDPIHVARDRLKIGAHEALVREQISRAALVLIIRSQNKVLPYFLLKIEDRVARSKEIKRLVRVLVEFVRNGSGNTHSLRWIVNPVQASSRISARLAEFRIDRELCARAAVLQHHDGVKVLFLHRSEFAEI